MRGLALAFALSFVNLVGVLVTAAAIGGVAPWSRWQFIGMYGVLEAASGLANVVSPNIWRLPVAQLRQRQRSGVKLAASVVLLPHWAGLARSLAGVVFIGLAAWHEGVDVASLGLLPLVLVVACSILAISAVVARAGVAWPEIDVVQFVVRRGTRERELAPISIGASVFQFLLTIATIPAAKLLAPSVLYQSAIAPSTSTLVVAAVVAAAVTAFVFVFWSGRMAVEAPTAQQREAEEHG